MVESEASGVTSGTFSSHASPSVLGWATSGGFHIFATRMEEVGEEYHYIENCLKNVKSAISTFTPPPQKKMHHFDGSCDIIFFDFSFFTSMGIFP